MSFFVTAAMGGDGNDKKVAPTENPGKDNADRPEKSKKRPFIDLSNTTDGGDDALVDLTNTTDDGEPSSSEDDSSVEIPLAQVEEPKQNKEKKPVNCATCLVELEKDEQGEYGIKEVVVAVNFYYPAFGEVYGIFSYVDLPDRASNVQDPPIAQDNFETLLAVDQSTSTLRWDGWLCHPLTTQASKSIPAAMRKDRCIEGWKAANGLTN